ncbi:hypothetical protein D3C80_1939130 [compost metagenome]
MIKRTVMVALPTSLAFPEFSSASVLMASKPRKLNAAIETALMISPGLKVSGL